MNAAAKVGLGNERGGERRHMVTTSATQAQGYGTGTGVPGVRRLHVGPTSWVKINVGKVDVAKVNVGEFVP